MTFLALLRKDLKRLVSDRRAFVVNLILPLVLTAIMGVSFGGGFFGSGGLSAIPVALVAPDLPEVFRNRLAQGLGESEFFAVTWTDSADADYLVREGEVAAAAVLPSDFGTRFWDGKDLVIEIWKDPGSPLKAGIVEQILTRGLVRYQAGEAAYRSLWPADAWAGEKPVAGFSMQEYMSGDVAAIWKRWRSAADDPALLEARDRFARSMDHQVALSDAMAHEVVRLQVEDQANVGVENQDNDINLYDIFLPGFAVFFLMFSVAGGARDLHRERMRGTLQRQLLSPVGPLQFLLGKWGSSTLQGILMLSILFVAGKILFQVNLGPDAWSLAMVILLTNTTAAGFFILLALVTPNEKTMDNLSTVVILVSAMLGGTFIPIDAMPEFMRRVGMFVFNYWANLGFNNVVARNLSLTEAVSPALVLTTLSLVLLGANLAVFRLRIRRGGLG